MHRVLAMWGSEHCLREAQEKLPAAQLSLPMHLKRVGKGEDLWWIDKVCGALLKVGKSQYGDFRVPGIPMVV